MTAASLCPQPDYLLGSPGRDVFMQALQLCHASVVIQCSPEHPLHERLMQEAAANRKRLERASWRAVMAQRREEHRNRKQRRAARRKSSL